MVKQIDHITINIDKKPFGKYKVISERAYNSDVVVQVRFQNQEFIWIPTFPEMGEIIKALLLAENTNRVNKDKMMLNMKGNLEKMGIYV